MPTRLYQEGYYTVVDDGSGELQYKSIDCDINSGTDGTYFITHKSKNVASGLFSDFQDKNGTNFLTDELFRDHARASVGGFRKGGSGGEGAAWGQITGALSNQTDLQSALDAKASVPSNVVLVESLSDFPTPVSDNITLAGNTEYLVSGNVDIGTNRITIGSNTLLSGEYAQDDGITSLTTGAVLTAVNANFQIRNLTVTGFSSSGLSLTGTGTENALFEKVTLITGSLGSCTDYQVFDGVQVNFISFGIGLSISGSMVGISMQGGAFQAASTSCIDITGVTAQIINISRMLFINNNSIPAIVVSPDGVNLNPGSIGVIYNCTFQDPANNVDGYSPLDKMWSVRDNQTDSVITSDRFEPNGWEFTVDDESTPTIAVSSTPTRLTVNGLGGNSNSDYLPKSIRGASSLWNTSTNKIEGITIGDSFDIRVQLGISATGGGADNLTCVLDIGLLPDGTGGIGSIVIAAVSQKVSAFFSPNVDTVIFSFPLFTLDTFITNGGAIFLFTDAGTVTIDSRDILIVRTSSGAS